MPATFTHCLLARKAIEKLGKGTYFPGVLKERNHFVVIGATGPDYPYLTDVITYGVMQIGHNWSNRMHYENIDGFILEGIKQLSLMDSKGDQFKNCLAWFCGYLSHVIADSFIHPVVNCTVGGSYMFTSKEHGRCELVQDIYIFNKITGTDICLAANRDSTTFGYLNILDDGSNPQDLDKIHPDIGSFWSNILKVAHPHASDYFEQIDPNEWHKNYKSRVDFVCDSRSIFRHVVDFVDAPRYVSWSEIEQVERDKYIENVVSPYGTKMPYDKLFENAVDHIVSTWKAILPLIKKGDTTSTTTFVKGWNLDTGVDERSIDLWMEV
jgi:hypothetical protein